MGWADPWLLAGSTPPHRIPLACSAHTVRLDMPVPILNNLACRHALLLAFLEVMLLVVPLLRARGTILTADAVCKCVTAPPSRNPASPPAFRLNHSRPFSRKQTFASFCVPWCFQRAVASHLYQRRLWLSRRHRSPLAAAPCPDGLLLFLLFPPPRLLRSVASSTARSCTAHHLAQLMAALPGALELAWRRVPARKGEAPILQLVRIASAPAAAEFEAAACAATLRADGRLRAGRAHALRRQRR